MMDDQSSFQKNRKLQQVKGTEKNGQFDQELGTGVHLSESNTATCPANTAIMSFVTSGVREAVTVKHNKRPSDIMPHVVEAKRPREEDQITSEDYRTANAAEDVPGYSIHRTCEANLNSSSDESDQSEDDGVDSPVHLSMDPTCIEDYLRAADFYQREELFSSVGICPVRRSVSIGPDHQAELPECTSWGSKSGTIDDHTALLSPSRICDFIEEDESDKWIRNCVMSVPDSDALSSRHNADYCETACDCLDQGSIECVRKHVRQAREKLKCVIGSDTFKELGFYDMGEEVASRWTEEEEHLFQKVVSSNPASLGRNFWDELPLAFPSRCSRELVSYYFNVYMLRKRAEQNRFDPLNVDSDNDEWQESDDGEFAIIDKADEDLPLEPLADQDDGTCNEGHLEGNGYEESNEEDEFDYADGGRQGHYCAVEGDLMASKGVPVMSFASQNQQTFKFDRDVQDDPCMSFEAQHVAPADEAPTNIAADQYRNDGLNGDGDHGYFASHCDPKTWDIGFTSGRQKDEFLSTNNVIEEVFGKGSCENENVATGDHGIS